MVFFLFDWSWETRMIPILNLIKGLSVFLLLKTKHDINASKRKRNIWLVLSLDWRKIIFEFLSTCQDSVILRKMWANSFVLHKTTVTVALYLPKTLNSHRAMILFLSAKAVGSYEFDIGGARCTMSNYWGSRTYYFALFCPQITEFP